MFASSLDNTLRKKGTTLREVVETGNLKNVSQEDVANAVDAALDFTYAKTPENFFAKGFVDFTNKLPFLYHLTSLVPLLSFTITAAVLSDLYIVSPRLLPQ